MTGLKCCEKLEQKEWHDTGQYYMGFIICGSQTKYYLDNQIEDEMGRPCHMHGKEEDTYKTNLKPWRARNHFEYLCIRKRIVFESDVI